jgi:hypothetical protein
MDPLNPAVIDAKAEVNSLLIGSIKARISLLDDDN